MWVIWDLGDWTYGGVWAPDSSEWGFIPPVLSGFHFHRDHLKWTGLMGESWVNSRGLERIWGNYSVYKGSGCGPLLHCHSSLEAPEFMGESTLVKLEGLTSLSLSLISCTRALLEWQCSEDAIRNMYLKRLALCQARSKCLKNRSACSCRYFRLLNSSNKTIVILRHREWKAKCGPEFQVTELPGEGQGWNPIPGLPTPGLSLCCTPLVLRTHSAQRSSSRPHRLGAFHIAPFNQVSTPNMCSVSKSWPCSFQNILQKCLLLSCLLVIVIAVLYRRDSPLFSHGWPLLVSAHVFSSETFCDHPCWSNATSISFLSLSLSF